MNGITDVDKANLERCIRHGYFDVIDEDSGTKASFHQADPRTRVTKIMVERGEAGLVITLNIIDDSEFDTETVEGIIRSAGCILGEVARYDGHREYYDYDPSEVGKSVQGTYCSGTPKTHSTLTITSSFYGTSSLQHH